MISQLRNDDEVRRLAVVRGYRIVDSAPDSRFDGIAELAARLTRASAFIGFLDNDRLWIKSRSNCDIEQSARPALFEAAGFPAQGFVVQDASQHERLSMNGQVVGPPFVRGYAGVPLLSSSGHAIGVLAVFDTVPRADFGEATAQALKPLAQQVLELLELDAARRAIASRDEELARMQARITRLQAADPSPAAMPCALFLERLAKTLSLRMFTNESAVLFFDVHAFTRLNAAFGRAAGDDALREIAARLRDGIGRTDCVTRRDADHFVVLMQDFDALAVAQLRETLEQPLTAGAARGVRLSFKIGGVRLTDVALGERPDRVLQVAESAASESVGPVNFAGAKHRAAAIAEDSVLLQLIEAVEQGSIDLHYQPLVDARSGRFTGFEALARWSLPAGVAVAPAQFMAMADRYGQAFPLGEQLLRKACSTCCDYVGIDPDFLLHVNVSPVQLTHPLFEVCVNDALRLSGMPAKNLCLEITEAAVADPQVIGPKIARIRRSGVRFALDDFGMGYSSLSHIRRLPVDAIKIDRFFVSGNGDDIADPPIVRTVTTLAKELGLIVVAEGVETAEQARFLRELGCDVLQGYYFGRPAPSREASATFTAGQRFLRV